MHLGRSPLPQSGPENYVLPDNQEVSPTLAPSRIEYPQRPLEGLTLEQEVPKASHTGKWLCKDEGLINQFTNQKPENKMVNGQSRNFVLCNQGLCENN